MSLWRRTRTECVGAWRSLRYDMGRRPVEPPADGPDVTSTGMNTFGGQSLDFSSMVSRPARRAPRRALAVSTFGLLTAVGATTAYLAVSNGLMPSLEENAAAGTLPAASAAATADAGIGAQPSPRVRSHVGKRHTVTDLPDTYVPPAMPATHHAPARTPRPTRPECDCAVAPHKTAAPVVPAGPPVPTPTAPTDPPSPTPSPSVTSARPSGRASAAGSDPDDSVDPPTRPTLRHRRFHG